MDQFLCEYLLTNKCCPLPGIGELQFQTKSATYSQMEQTMIPPMPEVVLVRRNVEEESLLDFISNYGGLTLAETRVELKKWCDNLLNMESGERFVKGVGSFYIDAAGRLQFRSQTLHSSLLPEVSAERVIRKEASHQILVGDKESTSVQMTEYFQEAGKVKRQRWWIAAAIMGAIAAIAISAYFATSPHPGFSGNRQAIPQHTSTETYTVPQ